MPAATGRVTPGPGRVARVGSAERAWQNGEVPVLLIRHAHSGSRLENGRDDSERHLSSKGQKQAGDLVGTLERYVPQRIVSSPSVRCIETVEPLARLLRLPVETEQALAEGSWVAAIALVRSLAHEKVALCTHGDVIAEILVSLADEDHLDLGARPRQAKGSVWVLEASANRFMRASYLPPLR